MKSWFASAPTLVLTLACTAAAADATLPGPAFPQFRSPAQVRQACDAGLADARVRLRSLEARTPDARWLGAYDDAESALEDAIGPISLLANVHPDPAMRAAAEACQLRWQDFDSTRSQSEALYRALDALKPADAIDAGLVRNLREGFEDSGVALPPAQRARAKAISDEQTALSQRFARNIRDAELTLAVDAAGLRGVPEALVQAARRDPQGRVLFSLDTPTFLQLMRSAEDGTVRERAWRTFVNEGGTPNLELLDGLVRLRREYAALFGVGSYADFVLRRRMAGSLENAERFLAGVKGELVDRERKELAELREAKQRHLAASPDASAPGHPVPTPSSPASPAQAPADAKLERWDVLFYQERLRRERYDVSQEAFRPYFPPEESLQFVLRVIETVMQVRYTRVPARLWAADVHAYAVSDARSGQPLATLYVDLYPRPGKYNHAAVWSLRSGSSRSGRAPQAALVVNLDRKGLTLDDLETLLHELGHAVHNNLSDTRYALQAGTSVLRDFVEAPSQMLEDWVYDPRVLALFGQVCAACKPVPPELLAKAVAARDADKGVFFSRQWLYGAYDLALHGPAPSGSLALWERMEGATPLGYVPGTMFPASFGHIAGGYAAGYYGYLWSLVVAMDLRTAFGHDKLDSAAGRRYRDTILANGSQLPPQTLVDAFLGRPTSSQAFFEFLRR